ncbi:MAG: glutamate-5-semialdehyde dehydrogenase [Phycisphaerales bacterium]|nr:glutamate-5-semialdehyde dehydrogenase [Phycisphaerales bacterium]
MAMSDWNSYVQELGAKARTAAQKLAQLTGGQRSEALVRMAERINQHQAELIEANAKDIAAAQQAGLADALVARLKLDETRVSKMAASVAEIAQQVDPVGQVIEGYNRPNGLRIVKMRVPLGVVLFFYESRPNVTSDAAALCIKSGNAVILRGGKEAIHSNQAIARVISQSLEASKIDPAVVQMVQSTDRALVPPLLKLDRYIDLVIPRGGESLIRAVVAESTIPVLKHFTGNCHIYIDASAASMPLQVSDVCVNAKTSYPGGAVCNAVEHLLIHKDALTAVLPQICMDLMESKVEIRGDERLRAFCPAAKSTTDADWDTEYLGMTLSIKVVDSVDDAIEHINRHGSRHTDAILATDTRAIERFVAGVDSASVMVNASTRFADGGEYGLGAEIGISTDKLHARGPMGATDLTTSKWIVTGNWHQR